MAITRSNVDLGSKNIPPIASTRREQSVGFFREAPRRLVSKRQGGRIDPPPLPGRVMENGLPGRGLSTVVRCTDLWSGSVLGE